LQRLQQQHSCHVAARGWYATTQNDLFAEETCEVIPVLEGSLVVECRVVKQVALEDSADQLVETVARGFEQIRGVDGDLRWFECAEGSAGYIRLLKEVPQSLRVPGL
jgi:hypothetical protein